ncbi:MAG: hypothetical protein P3W87_002255 [Gammaproteobacteria bacterium]|nr:hypothetical protein [Gammaproteobacteria bacterium]
MGTTTIQYRDAQHIRYDFKDQKPDKAGALRLLKDKLYAVTPQGEVLDMAMVAEIAGALGDVSAGQVQFGCDRTKETVAGVQGEVYRWSDGTHAGDVVLSGDARVKQLNQAMERMGDHMQPSIGGAQVTATFHDIRAHPALRDKGIVRLQDTAGSGMRLMDITEFRLADALFVLPKKTNAIGLPGLPTVRCSADSDRTRSRRARH